MRVSTVLFGLVSLAGKVLAIPPPEYERVLVVLDDTNADIEAASIVQPLEDRGFKVTSVGIKDHPKLHEYDLRVTDNVILAPGRVKAMGSTLKAGDIMKFMELGGNVVALSTPKYNPATLREVGSQLGIEIGGRGVQYQDNFNKGFQTYNDILNLGSENADKIREKSAVAKLSDANPFVLGLIQAPYTAYAWNAAKETGDDGEVVGAVSEVFGEGNELFLAAALQSTLNSRFVWLGSPELLNDADLAKQVTQWAFHEVQYLRVANATHSDSEGVSHLHYSVEQDLTYCAEIEEWDSSLPGWTPYKNIEDVQLEFKMLDPYYRLNLGGNGCVTFKTPEQYGMFTFQLDYKRPGLSFLEDKQVVTIHHRANNEWDRSWSIANSWVYLTGIGTTVIGFLLFTLAYILTDDGDMTVKEDVSKKQVPEPATSKLETEFKTEVKTESKTSDKKSKSNKRR